MSEENNKNSSTTTNLANMQKAMSISKNVATGTKAVASGNPYIAGVVIAWENKKNIFYLALILLMLFLVPVIYIQNTIQNLPSIIWENVSSIFGNSEVTLSEVLANIENLEGITLDFLEEKQMSVVSDIESRYDDITISYEIEEVEISEEMINIVGLVSMYSAKFSDEKELSSDNYKEFLNNLDTKFFIYTVTDENIYAITYLDKSFEIAFNLTVEEKSQANKYELALYNYLYGVGNGDDIVQVAYTQVGTNRGGFMYKSWYGMDSSVAWCAIFVSWVANQCNYIDTGVIPKFASCEWGKNWFINNGLWINESPSYIPKAGDIIFFRWSDGIGRSEHVGIVVSADENFVYTIEGNTGTNYNTNSYVMERARNRNNGTILGYGVPLYPTNEMEEIKE